MFFSIESCVLRSGMSPSLEREATGLAGPLSAGGSLPMSSR